MGGYNNILDYRPNMEAAQLIGSANPFASAAKYLGDSADRIRSDKVADSEIAYKNILSKSTGDANQRAADLHPEMLKKAQKENVKLDDDHAQSGETLRGTKIGNDFAEKMNPLNLEGRRLTNIGLGISNFWAPKQAKADINAKNADAHRSITSANIQKFLSLDPYGVQKAQAEYYEAGRDYKGKQGDALSQKSELTNYLQPIK